MVTVNMKNVIKTAIWDKNQYEALKEKSGKKENKNV